MANTQADATAKRWKSRCAANLLRWVTAIAKTADVIPPRRERVHVVEKRERSPYQRSGVPWGDSRAATSATAVIAQSAAATSQSSIRRSV